MADVVLIRDEAALRRLLSSPQGAVARTLAKKAEQVASAAKLIITADGLVDTGRYRASISWRLGSDAVGIFADIGSNLVYARFIEQGTPPHEILPRNKKALWWKTARHPVGRVMHPGTRARHVLARALRSAL